jgi:hypothetical protein
MRVREGEGRERGGNWGKIGKKLLIVGFDVIITPQGGKSKNSKVYIKGLDQYWS